MSDHPCESRDYHERISWPVVVTCARHNVRAKATATLVRERFVVNSDGERIVYSTRSKLLTKRLTAFGRPDGGLRCAQCVDEEKAYWKAKRWGRMGVVFGDAEIKP